MQHNRLLSVFKHLMIWLALIFLLFNGDILWGWTIDKNQEAFWVHIYGAITNATIFYFTSFYLIPRFYNQQLKRKFLQYSFCLIALMSAVEWMCDYYIGDFYQNRVFLHDQELETWNFIIQGFVYILPVNLFYFVIAFAYRAPIDRKAMFEREMNLQKEKLEAELKYLRSQIHPHTLFNGMSSIYHLIDLEPEKAKSLTLNLSNALRYHLYGSSDEFTLLSKEINYLRQYIALNQARIEDDVKVEIYFDELEEDPLIAPLLFTPYIENAFKYVSHFAEKEKNNISIKMKIEEEELYFECSNSYDKVEVISNREGGIGLENVKSRLNLIYAQNYDLQIKKDASRFVVELRIPLKKMP